MSFDRPKFESDRLRYAAEVANDPTVRQSALDFINKSDHYNHIYQWTWLDLPIIQMTEDIMAIQEIIWKIKPDVIIETGIAWGGSIVFSASMLQLAGKGKVIGVDVVLPQKNIDAMMAYPFSSRINLIEGSSIDKDTVDKVRAMIEPGQTVMLMLDSNHTHDHVLEELRLYAPMVTAGSYIVVSDTIVEEIGTQGKNPRPWGFGNNPKTATDAYLKTTDRFELDVYYNSKVLVSFDRGGFLRCVK